MTAKEALYLIDVQLAHTEQNLQAIKVLSDIVSIVDKTHIDDTYGTEAHPHNMGYDEPTYTLEHLFGDFVGDLDKLKLVKFNEPKGCARYELAEDDEDAGR
jgi:hypothetical protein